jgi:hypothetical protein
MKNILIKTIVIVVSIGLVVFVLLQFVPLGRDHTNPSVVQEPQWDSPQTRATMKRACFDCHSNETVWPWYSNIAPISWLLQKDVDEGREKINFSEWDETDNDIDDIYIMVKSGKMPLPQYLMMHPEAKFTPEETQVLLAGILATFGTQLSDD